MFFALIKHYLLRPGKLSDLKILYHFRKEREKRHGYCGTNLENEQYEWCAAKVNLPVDQIKQVVSKWIFEFPNSYLLNSRFKGVAPLVSLLKESGIKIAVYSDYVAIDKLKHLEIETDMAVASTDAEINCMKPSPKGLLHIMKIFNVQPGECLFIGDRDELDGHCAAHAAMPYLNVKMYHADAALFYEKLLTSLTAYKNKE